MCKADAQNAGQEFNSPPLHSNQLELLEALFQHSESNYHKLSPKQKEVLSYIALGHSTRTIAEILCNAENTIKAHMVEIYRRLLPGKTPEIHYRVFLSLLVARMSRKEKP